MKKITLVFLLLSVLSCTNSKEDKQTVKTKIVCGDSLEQEVFDENGNVTFIRIPGKCDTIVVSDTL